jgi:hypothetical protein
MISEDLQEAFAEIGSHDCRAIVAVALPDLTKCYSQLESGAVCEMLMELAKRLSTMAPEEPSVVEGRFFMKSGGEEDELSSRVFLSLSPQAESIVVVVGADGESVFCIGRPSRLVYLAVRTANTIEKAGPPENLDG